MNDNFYAVIMAGGGGTRLWPLSKKDRPKQLISFSDGQSLFADAVERLDGLFKKENIFVVTIADQVSALHAQAPSLPLSQFIIEPQPKGTASVIGLAAITLKKKNPDAIMAVLTADHIIGNLSLFHSLLKNALPLAEQNHLITLGIKPTYPATGYGYIETGSTLIASDTLIVKKFVEKPDKNLASQYLKEGNYYWNSGMFIWKAERILDEFDNQMPDLFKKLDQISHLENDKEYAKKFSEIWSSIKPQTIDYGIMEHAKDVVLLKADDMKWNDVGSWDSLYDFLPADSSGNVIKNKNSILVDSSGVLILGENENKLIASLGVQDLVIIETDKALLICKKGETQRIKEVIEKIKSENLDKFL